MDNIIEEKDTKQLGLRLAPDVRDRFQTLSKARGESQPETFKYLLDTHDLQATAERNPAHEASILAFKHTAQKLIDLHAASLAMAETATETARDSFRAELSKMDKLQQTNIDLETERSNLKKTLSSVRADFDLLKDEHTISVQANKTKDDRIAYLESQLTKADEAIKECDELRKENKRHLEKALKANGQIQELQALLQQKELEHVRALRDLENRYHNQIQQLTEEKHRALQELARLTPARDTDKK